MPIRTATVARKIGANGQALHRAMQRRLETGDQQPSEAEAALLEERQALKEEREKRKAQAAQPRPTALDRLVRTHHAQGKGKKSKKEEASAADSKKPKARRTRAEKHAQKDAAVEAARHTRSATSGKKPATK
jgi:hypothetical protein